MSNQDDEKDLLQLSTGVTLELRTPSPLLVGAAMKTVVKDEPKPPRVWIEAKGREEENPSDRDFVAAYQVWVADAGIRSLRALIPTGTKLHSKPDDMPGPEDDDYADLMESIGETPATGVHSRYVQWVLLVAASAPDLKELGIALMRRAGVREEDVRDAQAMFPGLEERGADNGVSPERGGEHGDPVRAGDSRVGTGD